MTRFMQILQYVKLTSYSHNNDWPYANFTISVKLTSHSHNNDWLYANFTISVKLTSYNHNNDWHYANFTISVKLTSHSHNNDWLYANFTISVKLTSYIHNNWLYGNFLQSLPIFYGTLESQQLHITQYNVKRPNALTTAEMQYC